MPVASKSALEFLRRSGRLPTPRSALPRLATGQLRIHRIPLKPPELDPGKMLDVTGAPPPDRGKTDPWPPPQEVD